MMDLLPPPMPLVFRPTVRVDGRYVGRHRSIRRGRSHTFEDHRPYLPGDSVRDVDWKRFAKSDQLYIKRHEMHTQLDVHLVLDASASMSYPATPGAPGSGHKGGAADMGAGTRDRAGLRDGAPSGGSGGSLGTVLRDRRDPDRAWEAQRRRMKEAMQTPVSKWDAAAQAAMGLGQVILAQQDRLGWAVVGGRVPSFAVPSRAGMGQAGRMAEALAGVTPAGKDAVVGTIELLAQRHRRAVLVVVSDLMGLKKDFLRACQAWQARGGQVLVVQVLHPDERHLPEHWTVAEAEDPETGFRIGFDAPRVAEAFANRSAEWVHGLQQTLLGRGVSHQLLVVGQPWHEALRAWLSPVG